MKLSSLVQTQLLLTGPARPRSMRERAHIARMVRARRAASMVGERKTSA